MVKVFVKTFIIFVLLNETTMEILITKVRIETEERFKLPDFQDNLFVHYFVLDNDINITSVKLQSGIEFLSFLLQDELRYIKEQCRKTLGTYQRTAISHQKRFHQANSRGGLSNHHQPATQNFKWSEPG